MLRREQRIHMAAQRDTRIVFLPYKPLFTPRIFSHQEQSGFPLEGLSFLLKNT